MDARGTDIKHLLSSFDSAMLVTHAPSGQLRARPMAIARAGEHGDLWFATRIDSPKVDEIEGDHDVNVSMQAGERFLSLSGKATLVIDRAALDQLWDEAWRAWFPSGKDSEQLGLIHVTPIEGDYWEKVGGEKVRLHFEPDMPLERLEDFEGGGKGQAPGTA